MCIPRAFFSSRVSCSDFASAYAGKNCAFGRCVFTFDANKLSWRIRLHCSLWCWVACLLLVACFALTTHFIVLMMGSADKVIYNCAVDSPRLLLTLSCDKFFQNAQGLLLAGRSYVKTNRNRLPKELHLLCGELCRFYCRWCCWLFRSDPTRYYWVICKFSVFSWYKIREYIHV